MHLHPHISSPHHVVWTQDDRHVMESFKVDACVCGYHRYKNVWRAVEKVVQYVREHGNTTDPYAVAVTVHYVINLMHAEFKFAKKSHSQNAKLNSLQIFPAIQSI